MNISVKEAKELIKHDDSVVVLDVRTKEEFDEKHLKNAINIDFLQISFEEKIKELDKNQTYLVHCRSGNRSFQVCNLMEKIGFKEVYNVDGSLLD